MERVRSAIKLRQLEYFLAVAESRHFSKAAHDLFVSQPTLSHQIAELESHLGMQLLNRSGKNVSLTEAGVSFRVYAMRVIAELKAGHAALNELKGLSSGLLRIGVSRSFVRKLLPPILGEFTSDHPGIELRVTEMAAGEIEAHLADGTLDIGIAFAPAELEGTELEPLLEERLMLVVRAGHELDRQSPICMRELDGRPMAMLGEEYSTRKLIDGYLKIAGAMPNVICETNSIPVMQGLVRNSKVVAIIPEGAISCEPGFAVAALTDPSPTRVSALLWSRHNFRTYAARTFAELIKERFQQFLPFVESKLSRTTNG